MGMRISHRAQLFAAVSLVPASIVGMLAETARAQDQSPVIIMGGIPEGFEGLAAPRRAFVDLYFGGTFRGVAEIEVGSGQVSFLDPDDVLKALPPITNPVELRRVISAGPHPSHPELLCPSGSNASKCGHLSPDTFGLIYDPNSFRISLFLNPSFIADGGSIELEYLQSPNSDLSIVSSFAGLLSGEFQSHDGEAILQNSLVVSRGAERLRSDAMYSDQYGFAADRLVVEIDRPEMRYSAGAFWTPGASLIGREKLLGAGFTTQIDTRLDKEQLQGSPLVVFLGQRARVDVFRNGRLLSSRIYESGNQHIDTTNFPDGSYEVTINIEELGLMPREERRFFSKDRAVTAVGRTDFFAYAGATIDERRVGSLRPSGDPQLQVGVARRFSEFLAVDGTAQVTESEQWVEIGANLFSPIAQFRLGAVGSTKGGRGGYLRISSSSSASYSFSFDLRSLTAPENEDLGVLTPPNTFGPVEEGRSERLINPFLRSYKQVSGAISYSRGDVSVMAYGLYRKDDFGSAYTIGPSLRWDFWRKGPLLMTVRGDFAATERGEEAFAGISLRFTKRRMSVAASAGLRSGDRDAASGSSRFQGAIGGTYTQPTTLGGDLNLGAYSEKEGNRTSLVASSELNAQNFSIAGDLARTSEAGNGATQYNLGFETTVALQGKDVAFLQRQADAGVVFVQVDGAEADDEFEVLVNDAVVRRFKGPKSQSISLPSYRAYDIRIRSVGERILAYDGVGRPLAVFPATVLPVVWNVKPVSIYFGRLVAPDGRPMPNMPLMFQGGWGQSDGDGYFQIEAAAGTEIRFEDEAVTGLFILPQPPPDSGFVKLGQVNWHSNQSNGLALVN